MKRFITKKVCLVWMSLLAVFIVLPGCGGGEAGGGKWNPVPPPLALRVTSVTPATSTEGIFIDAPLRAVFSEAMAPASINATTFTLQASGPPLGAPVAGTVSYNATSKTATFKPVSNLAPNTFYTATLTTGVKNLAGTALAGNYVWTFKTGATVNNLAPTVTGIFPANGSTGIIVTTKTIMAEFSKDMNPATLTAATFTVQNMGPPSAPAVAGTVVYNALSNTATFSPIGDLAHDTLYTVTVTNAATDMSGTALSVPAAAGLPKNPWTFRTAPAVPHVGPAAVPLGSAGTFRVLAGSALSNVDVVGNRTQVNGDVGVSPGTTVNAFTELVNIVPSYKLYAGGVIADNAKADLLIAFNNITARSTAAIALPGQIGGLTLAPGLYVNSTTSGISGTGANGILTLDGQGDATAVWIFKMGSTLITDPNTTIVCTNGCKAENIYWQVGSSATLGTGSIFYGTILAQTSISMNTNAVLHGRALTLAAAVSLDTNQIVP